MKSYKPFTTILAFLSVLALIALACQFAAPAAPTPTTVVTEPPAEPYPQPYPYPLATFDPYLAPAGPYPYAYPLQAAPLAPGQAGALYPGVLDGAEVLWYQAVSMLLNGEVTSVMQTHDLKVYLSLKDGRTLFAIEPAIDEVMRIIRDCGDTCKGILVATE
jgi:hypothetical protein